MVPKEELIQAVQLLTQQIIRLEYQLKNKDQLTKAETTVVTNQYQIAINDLTDLVRLEAIKMEYPMEMNKWSDTKPLTMIMRLSKGQELMGTHYYQNLMRDIALRRIR